MLRPISFSKRSYCFTNVWRRCHIAQIAVRQNHSATRVSTASESNEGLILHDSYNPLWNSTSPLKEMVSFDDFGALTVQKLLNDNREQELPLHEFLDQLLRPVPTIAETLEMGGALELNDSERDNLETALAEGYDVSALLGQLESRDPILLVQAPKRKPDLGPPTVATASVVSSAAVASEMIPQARTVSAGTPPTILPDIPSTSYQLSSPSSKPARETPQIDTVQLILNAVDAQNMEALSNIVSTEPWPRANQLGKRTREVILFVLENSSSAQAAFEHLKAFIETNPRHFLDHDLLLALATRAILDNGVISSIDVLQKTKDLCLSRMNSRNVSSRRYYQVFSAAIVKEGVRGSVKLFEALSRLNLLKNRNAYRSWIQAAFNETNSKTLANDVSNWMIITSSLRSTDGIDLLLDRILQSNECGPDLIARFLHHCQRIEHSSATLSELVCALVRNQHFDEAKMVFSKIYLVEKFLHVPLKRFVANNDITSVETMADLVSTFVFDEKKIGGKKKNEINDQPKSVLNMVLSKEMDKFVGSQSSKNTRNRKTKIIKRHRQDEGQLYELVVCLRDVWAKLATHEQSQAKLHSWCERNGVEKP